MPNFIVEMRRNQYDVNGLILACPVTSVILDGSDVIEWTNLAPAVQPDSTDPRFDNPIQSTSANQPELVNVGGQDYVRFTRTSSHYLSLPRNAGTWTGINEWTFVIVGNKGADNTNNQDLFWMPSAQIRRRNSSGNKAYVHGVTEQAGSGDFVDGATIVKYEGATGGEWFENGVSDYTGTCANVNPTANGLIGRNFASGDYVDFDMLAIYIWRRALEDTEIDFLFKYVDPTTSYSANDWANVVLSTWLDDTANPSRINPYVEAPHKYYKVEVPTGTGRWIQVASIVDGLVKPDTDLGGDLFTYYWIEAPVSNPLLSNPTGWSSICNAFVKNEGHHTLLITRKDGGSVIVHFDVEEV